jgi:ectoine hydroxylase-related dioxygenase (phytanoyl-CoA dioxygenase family)
MDSLHYSKKLEDDGVILMPHVIENRFINDVKKEYDQLYDTVTNTDIPKTEPIIVFWKHVEGEQKKIVTFTEMPSLWNMINDCIVPTLRGKLGKAAERLQLLETIIFNKPPKISNTLHWHQDVAYFPLKPNNQIAVWFPLEIVTKERGAMTYAIGSHKQGIRGSVNLHTNVSFDNEDRPLIPKNPEDAGFEVKTMEMTPNDMLVHNGYTWHYTGPNTVENYLRTGISVRFITDEAVFDPRPGQGAAFTKQVEINPGETFKGKPFPIM